MRAARRIFVFGIAGLTVVVVVPLATFWIQRFVLTRQIGSPDQKPPAVVRRGIDSSENEQVKVESVVPPRSIGSLMDDLVSAEWRTVRRAKLALEARGEEAIPAVIGLLQRDELVKLQNTYDLIYPGTTRSYGHGRLLEYDIDWLSARAGWVLEAITFEDFGFREPVIRNESSGSEEQLKRKHAAAADRARRWWSQSSGTWSRFRGLTHALQSTDPMRQASAVEWLRYGRTRCDGLDRDSFEGIIRPAVSRLADSKNERVRQQAAYLLENSPRSGWRIFCPTCGYDLIEQALIAQGDKRCPKCGSKTPGP